MLRVRPCVRVFIRASTSSSARLLHAFSSASVHARLRPCLCACVRMSAIVRVHIIKHPDVSGRMKSFASGRVFRSRTFEMYYTCTCTRYMYCTYIMRCVRVSRSRVVCCVSVYSVAGVNDLSVPSTCILTSMRNRSTAYPMKNVSYLLCF